MNRCEGHPDRVAIGLFVWCRTKGPAAEERAFLCVACADALWDRVRNEVMANRIRLVIEQPTRAEDFRRDWVERRAYFQWLDEGRPEGHHVRHFFQAQQEFESWSANGRR